MTIALGICEPSAPASAAAISALTARLGRSPRWLVSYRYWNDTLAAQDFTNARAAGCGVIVTLEPWLSDRVTGISLTSIAAGGQDATLLTFANWMAAAPCPVILRFAHEMNGNWYPWGTTNPAADFIAAYRYVVTYMRAHAPAVTHLWCPNTSPADSTPLPFSTLYPGDVYCDYVGLDGYNWVAVKSAPWHTLDYVLGGSYDTIVALAPSKPFVIGEMACNPTGGDKGVWTLEGLLTTVPVRMPSTAIVCWFDYDKSGAAEADWRFDSGAGSHAAFRRVAADPAYGGQLPPVRLGRPSRGVVAGAV